MTLCELLKVCRFDYIGLYLKGEFCGNFKNDEWSTWPEDCAYMSDAVISFGVGTIRLNGSNESAVKLDIYLMSPKDADVIKTLEEVRDKICLDSPVVVTALNYAIEKVRNY